MNKSKRKLITAAIFLAALILGWYHLRLGMKAIFVFRNNEPLDSWIAIIAGPLSTLPATVLALFKKRLGAYWLIMGGLISFAAFLFIREDIEFLQYILRVALMILIPMIGLGSAFIIISKKQNQQTTAT